MIGSNLGQTPKALKGFLLLLRWVSDINSKGTTNYNALLRLPDKGRAIKGFAVKRACDQIIMHSNFVQ